MTHSNDGKDSASRRAILAAMAAGCLAPRAYAQVAQLANPSTLSFDEVGRELSQRDHVSPGHHAQVLLRWGDAVAASAPAWSPETQSRDAQNTQFGYDNDFIAFMPLPYGSGNSNHGLLCVNHESARPHLMFKGVTEKGFKSLPRELMDVTISAHGFSVVEIELAGAEWRVVAASSFNRRLTGFDGFSISGPAAGHGRMQTTEDPTGRRVLGTLGNCAGGTTPWGTVLTAEENIHTFFNGDFEGTPEKANHTAMGINSELHHAWFTHYPRFDVSREPNEPNRFGWIVEIDPFEPNSMPVKRTALGRFRHEGAATVRNRDGRIVVYMGDDQAFEHIYRFISARPMNERDRKANAGILDEGVLSVARFDDSGVLSWVPMVWGQGPLTPDNGFRSQADVVIEARRAAKLLGATAMDRPEDMEVHPASGRVFVALTKNARRRPEQADAVNPRAANRHGHIIEMIPPHDTRGPDHGADRYQWTRLLLAGNPAASDQGAHYHAGVSKDGWLSCPDNLAIDAAGRLWIGTDGANDFGNADGLWVTDVDGPGRALTRCFYTAPIGAEVTGPAFTPDGTTLFCSIQHPGDHDGSTFDLPATRWPDFKDNLPPRPSVVAIRRQDGKPLG